MRTRSRGSVRASSPTPWGEEYLTPPPTRRRRRSESRPTSPKTPLSARRLRSPSPERHQPQPVVVAVSSVPAEPESPSAWFSPVPSHAWAERFFLTQYTPAWITVIATVVLFELYNHFSALSYVCLGAVLAIPAVLIPYVLSSYCSKVPHQHPTTFHSTPSHHDYYVTYDGELDTTPYSRRHWMKINVWIAVVSYIGNHFLTHYFYQVRERTSSNRMTICANIFISLQKFSFCQFTFFRLSLLHKSSTLYFDAVLV